MSNIAITLNRFTLNFQFRDFLLNYYQPGKLGQQGGEVELEGPGQLGWQGRAVEGHTWWPGRLDQPGRNFN